MNSFLLNSAHGFARGADEAAHPRLWDGLVFRPRRAWELDGNPTVHDMSPHRIDMLHICAMGMSPLGPTFKFGASQRVQQSQPGSWGLPCKIGTGTTNPIALTLQAYFQYNSSTPNLLLRSDNPTVATRYGYGLYVDGSSNDLRFFSNSGVASDADLFRQWTAVGTPVGGTFALTAGKWHHAIVTFSSDDLSDAEIGQMVMMNVDGRWVFPVVPGGGEIAAVHLAAHSVRIGAASGMASPDLQVALVNVWRRRLHWQEIDRLIADPLMMFRRRAASGLSRAARRVSLGGATLRRMNAVLTG